MLTRRLTITAAALIMALGTVLSGCGKEAAAEVDVSTVADAVKGGITFQDELKEIDGSILENFYPTVDQSMLKGFKLYKSSSGATAEEIAVFEAKDADGVKALEAAVATRLEDLTLQFEDYIPAEMKKIQDAVRGTYGNVVVLVVAEDAAGAQKILGEQF